MSARVYFDWTESRKHRLAVLVQKYLAHIKSDKTFKDKWEKVLDKLKADADFQNIAIGVAGIEAAFKRFQKEVLNKAGISEEGPNLSGLAEEPNDYEKLMILLAQETAQQKAKAKVAKNRKGNIRKGLLTHEEKTLTQQGQVDSVSSLITTSTTDKQTAAAGAAGAAGADGTKKPRGRTFFDTFGDAVNQLTEKDPQEIDAEKEERRRRLDMELKEREQRLDHQERQLRLHEEQLQLQKAQLDFFRKLSSTKDNINY